MLVSEWFVVFGMLIIQTLLTSSILEDTFLLPLPVSAKHETRYKQRHPKPATKSSAPNPQVWKVLKNSLKGFRVCCLLFFFRTLWFEPNRKPELVIYWGLGKQVSERQPNPPDNLFWRLNDKTCLNRCETNI